MHSSKRDMLSARNTSLYVYGTYHTCIMCMVRTIHVWSYRTRMVYKIVPYAYGTYDTRMVHTIRVWYVPYAYGIKCAYGTEHYQDEQN